jgi:5'-3' exonuclease
MGIRGLTQLVTFLKQSKKLPLQNIQNFQNEIWAIDASLFLYRARSMSVTNNEQITRKPTKFRNILSDVPFDKSHLVGIIDIFCQLLHSNIIPLFIFDGEPPTEKNDTISKRRIEKIKLQKKIEWVEKYMIQQQQLHHPSIVFDSSDSSSNIDSNHKKSWADIVKHKNNNNNNNNNSNNVNITNTNLLPLQIPNDLELTLKEIEDIRRNLDRHKQQISAIFLEPQHVYQTQTLCQILGIPFLQSNGEAEVSCASLQKNGIVNAIYTADSDVLVYGCTKMIRRIYNNNTVDVLDHDFVLKELNLTHEQFVRFCILMGCDFCDGLVSNNSDITPNSILKIAKNPDLQNNLLFDNFIQSMGEEWVEKAYKAFELYTQPIQPEIQQITFNELTLNEEQIQFELQDKLQMEGGYIQRLVIQIKEAYDFYFHNDLTNL